MNATDKIVSEYLTQLGVTYSAVLIGERKDKDWVNDEWATSFKRGAIVQDFEFHTGIGHRTPAPRLSANQRARPVQPSAASVLHSVLLDASCASDTFENFCAELGYDTDSRKALATYLACQENAAKLAKIFKADELKHLGELLQDY